MTFAGFLIRFRAKPHVLPSYLLHALQRQATQQFIQQNAVVSTILNFNAERYGDLVVMSVPSDVQAAVVRELDQAQGQVWAATQVLQQSLDLLVERRRSLITHAVTGQFDVTAARSVA